MIDKKCRQRALVNKMLINPVMPMVCIVMSLSTMT